MTNLHPLRETDHTLLIRARQAWVTVRDAQHEGRALADGLVREARTTGDRRALVAALRARGWAEREMFAFAEAQASLDEAVRLARRTTPEDLAEVLATRASVNLERGRVSRARRDIALARAALTNGTLPEVDAQEAVIEDAVGNLRQAARLYRDASRRAANRLPIETAFTVHNNLGLVLAQLGDHAGSRTALRRAQVAAQRLGRNKLGYVTHNLAVTSLQAGAVSESLRYFNEAEAIFRGVQMPLAEHYMERFDAFMTLRLLTEALDAADRAVIELEREGFALLVGEARLRRARAHLALGDAARAEMDADRAVDELSKGRGPVWRAKAELVSIEAALISGSPSHAQFVAARRTAGILMRAGLVDAALEARLLAARIALDLNDTRGARAQLVVAAGLPKRRADLMFTLQRELAEARRAELSGEGRLASRAARRGLATLSKYRLSLPTTELRALAAGHGVELAMVGVRLARQGGRARDVLRWIEQGRVVSALHDPPRPNDVELAELFGRLREVSERRREATDTGDTWSGDQARLEAQITQRLRTLDSISASGEGPATIDEIVDGCRGRVLIELGDLDGQLVMAGCAQGRSFTGTAGSTADARRELQALLASLRRILRGRTTPAVFAASVDSVRASLERLDQALVASASAWFGEHDHVIVAPPAEFFALPWHALPSLAGRTVSVVPSATVWLRATNRTVGRRHVVLVAGPRLAGALGEVHQIRSVYRNPIVLTPTDATVPAVLAALDGARIAHLACHGRFRADNPSFSALELTDGPLTVLDIERLRRAPRIVVLAACDSGVSDALPGNELLGLTSSLLATGAAALVATIVPVPDAESSPIMVRLHKELRRGESVAAALGIARGHADPADPFGFVCALAYGCFGSGAVTAGVLS